MSLSPTMPLTPRTTPPSNTRTPSRSIPITDPRRPISKLKDLFTSPVVHLKFPKHPKRSFYPPANLLKERSTWWSEKIQTASSAISLDDHPDDVALYLRLVDNNTLNVLGNDKESWEIAQVYVFAVKVEDRIAKDLVLCALNSWLWSGPEVKAIPYLIINQIWNGTNKNSKARLFVLDHIRRTNHLVSWIEEYNVRSLSRHFLSDLAQFSFDRMPRPMIDDRLRGDFTMFLEEEAVREKTKTGK